MNLKTPQFWVKKSIISLALLPFSLIYLSGFFLVKIFTKTKKISKLVICVGNLISGGSGKTPTAIAIGKILQEMGIDFAFLSRGYMNDGTRFLELKKSDEQKVSQTGDEPLILLSTAPTFIAKDRFFAAQKIERMKRFQAIVLDDGMQDSSLYHDFTILVIDGEIAFGNGLPIPAGPMRELLKSGLSKADLVVIIGKASQNLLHKLRGKKILKAQIVAKNLSQFFGKKLIAFCGLAYPQKFFSFLKNQSLEVIETHAFADHYPYHNSDLKKLLQNAESQNATLVTTKKDWVKFPPRFQEKVSYLDIELEFENKDIIKDLLQKIL